MLTVKLGELSLPTLLYSVSTVKLGGRTARSGRTSGVTRSVRSSRSHISCRCRNLWSRGKMRRNSALWCTRSDSVVDLHAIKILRAVRDAGIAFPSAHTWPLKLSRCGSAIEAFAATENGCSRADDSMG